tara:strand:- start:192 stop:1232 length:1041 start_codon:yes stop_codon:yes gene_type:complete
MSVAINGTDGITFNDGSLQPSAPVGRNLIINGNMQIAQRGTSFTVTGVEQYTVDRFNLGITEGTFVATQDTDVPSGQGFASSLKIDSSSAIATLAAGTQNLFEQRIEAQNLTQLSYGTANAKTITLSFWVKSNKTGTYILWLYSPDTGNMISNSYTISVADTWEKKTITIVGDTVGVIANNNDNGLFVRFMIGAGSTYQASPIATSWTSVTSATRYQGQVNLADSTSNYINITGVQLEANTTATPFEHLQYGQQLALCQRYFQLWQHIWNGVAFGSEDTTDNTSLMTEMRAAPTVVRTGGTFDTRYPSSSWVLIYTTNISIASRVRAGTAGGNDGWKANGTLEAEL